MQISIYEHRYKKSSLYPATLGYTAAECITYFAYFPMEANTSSLVRFYDVLCFMVISHNGTDFAELFRQDNVYAGDRASGFDPPFRPSFIERT